MQPNDLLPAAHRNQPLDYAPEDVELEDMVLVNPGGRVIEVTGEQGQELLQQMGYRRATEQEASQIEDYKKRTHPELLRRAEIRRVRQERAAVDELEREIAGEESTQNQPKPNEGSDQPSEETPKPRSRK